MRMLLFLLATLSAALASPVTQWKLHEKRNTPLSGKRLDGKAIIPLAIALAQSGLEHGYDHLIGVSDPESPGYGKHWTIDDIHAAFAPSEETVAAVTAWLREHGVDIHNIATSASRGWISFDIRVADAERLLSTEYYEHVNDDGDLVIACDEYHLPLHIGEHIDYVSPGIASSRPMKKIRRHVTGIDRAHAKREVHANVPDISPTDLSSCGKWMTPACLKALYQIPTATLNQTKTALGIFANSDVYDQEDLNLFFSNFAPWVPTGTHPDLVSINGAKAPVPVSKGGVESSIDFDLAHSLLYPQAVTLYQTQSTSVQQNIWIQQYGLVANTTAATFLPFVHALDGKLCTQKERETGADCGTIELTQVLSVSYGTSELRTPERAAKRICSEFMKLALRGHTLLLASQDEGVAQRPAFTLGLPLPWTNGCINPEHIELSTINKNGTIFNPTFPATCPFVTSVGATQLTPGETIGDAEEAMFAHSPLLTPLPELYTISSGGGISNYFPVPEYQRCAIEEYFAKHNPGYATYKFNGTKSLGANGGIHAMGGRGFPDISANGAHMPLYVGGQFLSVPNGKGKPVPIGQAGTSLSTPIVASMITMINQQRSLAGKSAVGFINPVIYKHPEVFSDVVKGKNPGCGTEGFPAAEGWDPITGLGTPNYPKLLELFMSLA